MARGLGKYHQFCQEVRILAEAKGVLIIVLQGCCGDGVASHLNPEQLAKMPELLRAIAEQIEADLAAPHWPGG